MRFRPGKNEEAAKVKRAVQFLSDLRDSLQEPLPCFRFLRVICADTIAAPEEAGALLGNWQTVYYDLHDYLRQIAYGDHQLNYHQGDHCHHCKAG